MPHVATTENAKDMLAEFAEALAEKSQYEDLQDESVALLDDMRTFVINEFSDWEQRIKAVDKLASDLSLDAETQDLSDNVKQAREAFNNIISTWND